MATLLAVAAGGAIGACARFLVGLGCERLLGDRFGYGTLLVNVVGCFALGLLAHGGAAAALRQPWLTHPGLTAGLLGGLTTFSTFGYQTLGHIERGEWRLAGANVAANLILGLAGVALGLQLSRLLDTRA
ncbi:MAG: CrcB family protein [Planctomycetota bacterium]